jgi:hypothetical protein
MRLLRQLDVQADHVRLPQQVVQLHKRDTELARPFRRRVKCPRQDAHADSMGEPRHLRRDAAGANQAERLAAQKDIIQGGPAALLQLVRLKPRPPRHGEHQCQGVLGDDRGSAARDVAHGDTHRARHLEVDGVGADAADGEQPQPGQLPHHIGSPLHGAAGVDEDRGVLGAAHLLGVCRGTVTIEDDLAEAPQPLQVRRALQLRRVVAGDHNGNLLHDLEYIDRCARG